MDMWVGPCVAQPDMTYGQCLGPCWAKPQPSWARPSPSTLACFTPLPIATKRDPINGRHLLKISHGFFASLFRRKSTISKLIGKQGLLYVSILYSSSLTSLTILYFKKIYYKILEIQFHANKWSLKHQRFCMPLHWDSSIYMQPDISWGRNKYMFILSSYHFFFS